MKVVKQPDFTTATALSPTVTVGFDLLVFSIGKTLAKFVYIILIYLKLIGIIGRYEKVIPIMKIPYR
jgi:hypothetical protein